MLPVGSIWSKPLMAHLCSFKVSAPPEAVFRMDQLNFISVSPSLLWVLPCHALAFAATLAEALSSPLPCSSISKYISISSISISLSMYSISALLCHCSFKLAILYCILPFLTILYYTPPMTNGSKGQSTVTS